MAYTSRLLTRGQHRFSSQAPGTESILVREFDVGLLNSSADRHCSRRVGTLGDALQIAMDLEQSASVLYADLAHKMDSQARPMVLTLAADGWSHYEQLQRVLPCVEFEGQLSQLATVRLCSEGLRRFFSLPELGSDPTEDDVLNYAEIRERLACDYYHCLARVAPPGPVHDLITELRDHKRGRERHIRSCCDALFLIF